MNFKGKLCKLLKITGSGWCLSPTSRDCLLNSRLYHALLKGNIAMRYYYLYFGRAYSLDFCPQERYRDRFKLLSFYMREPYLVDRTKNWKSWAQNAIVSSSPEILNLQKKHIHISSSAVFHGLFRSIKVCSIRQYSWGKYRSVNTSLLLWVKYSWLPRPTYGLSFAQEMHGAPITRTPVRKT